MGKFEDYFLSSEEKVKEWKRYSEKITKRPIFTLKAICRSLECNRGIADINIEYIDAIIFMWLELGIFVEGPGHEAVIKKSGQGARAKLTWRGLRTLALRGKAYAEIGHGVVRKTDMFRAKTGTPGVLHERALPRDQPIIAAYVYASGMYLGHSSTTIIEVEKGSPKPKQKIIEEAYREFARQNYRPEDLSAGLALEEVAATPKGLFDYKPTKNTDTNENNKQQKPKKKDELFTRNELIERFIGLKTPDRISKQILNLIQDESVSEEQVRSTLTQLNVELMKEIKPTKRVEVLRILAGMANLDLQAEPDETLEAAKAAMLKAKKGSEEKERQRILDEIRNILKERKEDQRIRFRSIKAHLGRYDIVTWGDLTKEEAQKALSEIEKG